MSPSVAVVSAPGRGAVAVIRIWGEGALDLVDRAFRPNRGPRLGESPKGRLRVGRISSGPGPGDEVVAVVVDEPLNEVEVQCHGGLAAVQLVVEALESGGARVRSPRAWVRHRQGSAIRAEAELALAEAPTVRTAEILMDQVEGALDSELQRVLEADPASAVSQLDALIDRSKVGTRLVNGWRVVLAGRPNVGKSRLLNALAGYDRSIVDPSPGTTRDLVTVHSAFEGWPVELADTAGLRESCDSIEAQGVALARIRQRSADLVLVVLDRSEPLHDLDRAILADHPDALIVANKCDLPAAWDASEIRAVAISAERGIGVEALVESVARKLIPVIPPADAGVPFRPIHVRRLEAIQRCIRSGHVDRARRSLARWLR